MTTTRAVLCAWLLSGFAVSASAGEVGKVDMMRPEVGSNDCGDEPLQDLFRDDPIEDDRCVWTGSRAAVAGSAAGSLPGVEPEPGPPGIIMRFHSGRIVGLGPDCSFDVQRNYLRSGAFDFPSTFSCDLLEVCPPTSRSCKDEAVETLAARIWPEGTIFHLRVEADGSTEVAVFEGSARVASLTGGSVDVEAGFRTYVKKGKKPTLPAPIDGDDEDRLRATFNDSPWLDGAFDFEPLKDF